MTGNNTMMTPCLKTMPMTAPAALVAAVLMASVPALAQTTVAGVTSGALSVDETGSAGYTIPIAVPPGIAGMQPSLALVYKSHGGNGTAGVGWSLSASSSIHRCSQTLVQDGAIHGVDFSAEDRFCLDGQRLVAVSGVYGADGTEYRTEIDGFARIISHGVAGSGPERFTVESKSGQTLDYGNTTDSRLGVPGASEVRLWSLSRVTDPSGNVMTYHYIEDPADKSYRLDKVAYAYDAAVTTAKSEVRFLYEARPDTRTSYLAGSELAMTKRLSKIETWADTSTGLALVKDYRLTYELSPATSRSRITSIKECDASNNCLAPLTMNWPTYKPGWVTDTAYILPDAIHDYTVNTSGGSRKRGELADLNGDGLPDWLRAYKRPNGSVEKQAYLNTGSGWLFDASWNLPDVIFDYTSNTSGGDRRRGVLIDINGDGLTDWVRAYKRPGGSVEKQTYLNTGSGWLFDANWNLPDVIFDYTSNTSGGDRRRGVLVDINGDGLPDWLRAYKRPDGSVEKQTYLNTGSGWLFDASWNLPDVIYDYTGSTSGGRIRGELVDINGDGLIDWIRAYRQPDGSGHQVTYLNTGSGWVIDANYQLPDFIYDYYTLTSNAIGVRVRSRCGSSSLCGMIAGSRTVTAQRRRGEFIDVNGDGLPDWVRGFRGTNGTIYKTTWINTGVGWEIDPAYAPAGILYDYDEPNTNRGAFFDVNGDGLVDWVRAFRRTWSAEPIQQQTYLNTGSGWQHSVDYKVGFLLYDMLKTGSSPWRHGDLADVNGDGLLDWVRAYKRDNGDVNKSTSIARSSQPDLLTSITDSLGRVSTLTYAPLTDDAVYTKDSDAVFPVVDIQTPLYVVKSVSSDDGLGGQAVTSYGYAGAKVHVQGRGFRGFRQMTATDEQIGIVTTTDYHQVFPYTAQVTRSVKTLADATTIKTIDNTWDQLSLNGGETVYPYVASSTSEDYEINDGVGNSPVVSRTASAVFDTHGNPTSLTTTTTGGGESFTETTVNTYDNDTTNWFLGLLRRSEVTRSRGTAP